MTKLTNRQALEPNVWSHLACERAHREKVRVCAYSEVLSVHLPSRSWQLPLSGRETGRKNKKNLRSAQDYKWSPESGELDNNWDLFALTPRTSLLVLVCAWLWRCCCYRWSHHSLSCHPWECPSCNWWSRDEELHHVGLSVHVEDEVDEKYVGLRDPMCYFVLCANALEFEVLLCLELIEGWQEHLLMLYNLVVDTVVLLVPWNRRLSCGLCFHIVFAVGKVHHDWCQSWRCNRGAWPTLQSNRVPIETLGILRRSAIGPVCGVSVLLFLHPWLYDDPSAMGCDHFSFLLKWLLRHGSNELLTLQMLFWFGPSSIDRVEARRRIDTVQSVWYVLQARKTLNCRQSLSQFNQLQIANLADSATWFFTEERITFRQVVTKGFWAWSHLKLFQLFIDVFHLLFIL